MLAQAPKEYVRIGLSLNATNEELAKRLALREAETGKHVPMSVVVEMLKSYSPPSKAEGFDHLWELS
jgi:hypothetical protein